MFNLNFQWAIHSQSLGFPTTNSKFYEGKEPEPFLGLYSYVQNDVIQIFIQPTYQESKLDTYTTNFKTTKQL